MVDEEAMFASLVSTMDVEAEPQVAKAVAEYARRYAGELLIAAKDYSKHAGKRTIDDDDFALAMNHLDGRFNTRQVRRRVIRETAKSVNSRPLPAVPEHTVVHRLPPKPETNARLYTFVPGIDAYPNPPDEKTAETSHSRGSGTIARKESKISVSIQSKHLD